MEPKCTDLNKLVTALCFLCHAHSFMAKVDVEGNETWENSLKYSIIAKTVLII